MLVRSDGRLGREGRLLRTLVGLVVLVGALALAPRAFASGAGATGTDNTEPTRAYVVADGDTLWAITARNLGPGATSAQVASAWPAWYATNRSTIGSDPDLILPGQRLAVPKNRPTINREESR